MNFYCPEHKYNPPANSGFAFCPQCELGASQRTEARVNSEGLAACRCGSENAYLGVSGAEGEVLQYQAECPRCDRRGARASKETAIQLWNNDVAQVAETEMNDTAMNSTEPNTTELSPCPFCGNTNKDTLVVTATVHDDPRFYSVVCYGCCSIASGETRDRVIERWNTRVSDTTNDEEITRCAHCGSTDIEDTSGEYETGVVAPDGYRERRYENAFHCTKCGRDQEYD